MSKPRGPICGETNPTWLSTPGTTGLNDQGDPDKPLLHPESIGPEGVGSPDNRGIGILQYSAAAPAGAIYADSSKPDSYYIGRIVILITLKARIMWSPEFLGASVVTVRRGARMKVLKTKGSWWFVEYRSRKGWIHKNRVKKKTIKLSSGGTGSGTARGEAELSGRG